MTNEVDKKSSLPEAGDRQTLYIVDISGYVFRAYYALPTLTNTKGEPTHAVLGVTSMLLKLIREQNPYFLAIAMDSRTKSFRHELYPAYKATRPPAPSDLKQQMERVRQVIDAYGITVLQQDGMEADDIIASATRAAQENKMRVVIVSADKDLLQLVEDNVWMFDSMRNKVYGPDETELKLGVRPNKVRDLLALMGDSSDNIPGVPSVGPKTAVKLLSEYSSLDGVYRNIDKIKGKALKKKLEENRDQAYLSQRLVSLRSDLDVDCERDRLKLGKVDGKRLMQIFTELEFSRLIDQHIEAVDPSDMLEAKPLKKDVSVNLVRTISDLKKTAKRLKSTKKLAILPITDRQPEVDAELLSIAFGYESDSDNSQDDSDYRFHSSFEVSAVYIPFGPGHMSWEEALPVLKPILEDDRLYKVCTNTKTNAIAFAKHEIALNGIVFDTMLASYLLDSERRAHSLKDIVRSYYDKVLYEYDEIFGVSKKSSPQERHSSVDHEKNATNTYSLIQAAFRCSEDMRLRLRETKVDKLLTDIEIPLSYVLARMELTGVRIDCQRLSQLSKKIQNQLHLLERECIELAGREFNIASPQQLQIVLFDELGLPVIKRTKNSRSTDRDTLEELSAYHRLPLAVLEHRSLAKLKNTYLDTLPQQVNSRTQRIHTRFHQVMTATGRLSSSDPNLQNIPIRTELGRSIREAFIAQDGWDIFSADYSQVELRILAHLSRDQQLIEAFNLGQDVHSRTASAIFGVDEDKVTQEMRAQAKTVNFAVIYGQSHFALARNLRIERSQAKNYIEAFFQKYSGVNSYMSKVIQDAIDTGYVQTLCGRRRQLTDLRNKNHMKRQAAERIARNTPIQGTAADIIKLAMVAIHREMMKNKMKSRMLITVHDELVFEAPPEEKTKLEEIVCSQMESAMSLDVPLVVDRGWGQSWGEAH